MLHQAGRGGEGLRVLGVDPAFDRVAAELDVLLAQGQRMAVGDADLLADQIEAGDRLGHRMLDLQPGVHLDEVEFAVLPEELDRAGAAIAHVGHRLGDRSRPSARAPRG